MKANTKKKKSTAKTPIKRLGYIVRMVFVPHQKNDYRPHLVRRYGLIAITFIVVGMQMGYNQAVTGRILGLKTDITINELLDQTNNVRSSYNLGTLKLNQKLNQAAILKAKDMFEDQYWAHVAPDGTQPWKWFADAGYEYSEAGENLAKNFTTTSAAMTAWMNSVGHRANILNGNYQEVGFAVMSGKLDGKDTSIVVALYGTPATVAAATTTSEFSEPEASNTSLATKFAVAIQSLTTAAIIGVALIMLATFVAGLAHAYRKKLPKPLRNTWYRHHGLIKAAGLSILSLVVLLFYSGGQI